MSDVADGEVVMQAFLKGERLVGVVGDLQRDAEFPADVELDRGAELWEMNRAGLIVGAE